MIKRSKWVTALVILVFLIQSIAILATGSVKLAADNSAAATTSSVQTAANNLAVSTTGLDSKYKPEELNAQSDRFIIKYKNDEAKEKVNNALKGKVSKIKSIENKKGNAGNKFDVVSFSQKKKLKDVMDELENEKMDNEIAYIQPDYQLKLSSNDTFYNIQWGVQNFTSVMENISSLSMQERYELLSSSLKDAIDKNPEFKDFLLKTPQEELKQKLNKNNVPKNNLSSKILKELAHSPILFNTKDSNSNNKTYSCDANVTEAWKGSNGSDATVAIIDTGVDITHEDLAANTWSNKGEIPGNGKDDDGNGYIDDVNGWNFSDDNNAVHDMSTVKDEKHGTHIAGIIAAIKDNKKGIAGVAPSAKIMPLKVFKDGVAFTSDIIEAIQYAQASGAKIVNASWGSADNNQALKEAIEEQSGMLFICSAGNSSASIDVNPVYPAAYDCPNIISVASIDRHGKLSSFSNYGENNVDVAAPGEDIVSTLPGNTYGQKSGTSMSAAFVSGEAALLISKDNSLNISQIKDAILSSSDRLSSLESKVYMGYKINMGNAVLKKNRNYEGVITVTENSSSSATGTVRDSSKYNLYSAGDDIVEAYSLCGEILSPGDSWVITKLEAACIRVHYSRINIWNGGELDGGGTWYNYAFDVWSDWVDGTDFYISGCCSPDLDNPVGFDIDYIEYIEADSQFSTATPIQVGTEVSGQIGTPGEYDYYSFVAPSTGEYRIESTGSNDTVGWLFDSSETQIDYNDEGQTANFCIVHSLVGGQTYYIKMRFYNTSITGSYGIQVNSNTVEYEYVNNRLTFIKRNNIRIIQFNYDNNGNLISKVKLN